MPSRIPALRLFAMSVALSAFAACSNDTIFVEADDFPLDDLAQSSVHDSIGVQPPAPSDPDVAGYFRGTVLGPSAPGAGNDSLATAPRVAGATIRAFTVIGMNGTAPVIDVPITTVTSDASGKFTLPTLPAGLYVVTITPPEGSSYDGVWVTATAHATSHEHAWWVVLPNK